LYQDDIIICSELSRFGRRLFFRPHDLPTGREILGFWLQEEEMPVAELDISPYVGVPVKQGHIDFMFKQLEEA
jgi:hypothetical protein